MRTIVETETRPTSWLPAAHIDPAQPRARWQSGSGLLVELPGNRLHGLLALALLGVGVFFRFVPRPGEVRMQAVIALALVLVLFEFRGRFEVSPAGLHRRCLVTRFEFLPWTMVTSIALRIRYPGLRNSRAWFELRGPGRRSASYVIDRRSDGIADFAELALGQLPQGVLERAPDAWRELREIASRW